MSTRAKPKPAIPLRKRCSGPCGKRRAAKFFRLLKSGYLQGMCRTCEKEYDRERWHQRPAAQRRRSKLKAAA